MRSTVTWLNDAILYEIYPPSFGDANGDGVGDLAGVLEHLGHLQWLGVNTVWFNPCFASPFRDAGYDVFDYLQIAPGYGTNEEMDQVVAAARERHPGPFGPRSACFVVRLSVPAVSLVPVNLVEVKTTKQPPPMRCYVYADCVLP